MDPEGILYGSTMKERNTKTNKSIGKNEEKNNVSKFFDFTEKHNDFVMLGPNQDENITNIENIELKASAYTPVPGGVGPMTINTLILHTLQSAQRSKT